MRRALANTLLLTAFAITSVHAEDMRCGSRLIEVGMSRAEVLQYCGEPSTRDTEEQPVRSGKQVTGTTAIERWTYSSYSRTRTLVFDGDRLISID